MIYYKAENIKLSLDDLTKSKEREALIKKIKLKENFVKEFKIVRKSLDARSREKDGIFYVYSFCFFYSESIRDKRVKKIAYEEEEKIAFKEKREEKNPPLIVGSGPAGLFCAYALLQQGICPVILERGEDMDKRVKKVKEFWEKGILDVNSNVQFGLGGAGTFSDGKLNSRIKSPYAHVILDIFTSFGLSREIKYLAKPHGGTDKIRNAVKELKEFLVAKGAIFRFNSTVTDLIIKEGKIKGVVVNEGEEIFSDNVVFAIGNGARDTFEMLNKRNIQMENKPFAVGFRAEHLQEEINKFCYGKYYKHPALGAAEYVLKYKDEENQRGVYSFCNCPGGVVIGASSEEWGVVTNGMSFYSRAMTNANSAIVVNVDERDYGKEILGTMNFQRKLERKAFELGGGGYRAPVMSIKDFCSLEGKCNTDPTYLPGIAQADLNDILPPNLTGTIKRALKEFTRVIPCFDKGILTAVETRTSSPVRILRDINSLEALGVSGFYPVGEGAGYAGGILSSAVDGYKSGERIALKFDKTLKSK